MPYNKGTHKGCTCIVCESVNEGALDYSSGSDAGLKFNPIECEFCRILEPKKSPNWCMKPLFIPTVVKDFLKVQWLCKNCINRIHWKFRKRFRACWGTAHEDVMKLTCLMIIRDELVSESNKYLWCKRTITDHLKKGLPLPPWAEKMLNVQEEQNG